MSLIERATVLRDLGVDPMPDFIDTAASRHDGPSSWQRGFPRKVDTLRSQVR